MHEPPAETQMAVILSLPGPFRPTIREMTTGGRPEIAIAIGIAIAIDARRANPAIR